MAHGDGWDGPVLQAVEWAEGGRRVLQMPRYRLGVVSYLNSRPLIYGLEAAPDFELTLDVPARLPALLDAGRVDAALVPVVDLVRPQRDWVVVSDGCIACDGETFTVRVFSRVPLTQVDTLHVDGDSHTSVALAKLLWRESFGGRDLIVEPFERDQPTDACQAILLIGDKVVGQPLIDFDIETDLGSAWKSLTGLPFVFAVWAGRSDVDHSELAGRLGQARDQGVAHAEEIAERIAPTMGWPVELAKRYLTRRLQFTLTPRHRQGMELFLEKARTHGLISAGRELSFV